MFNIYFNSTFKQRYYVLGEQNPETKNKFTVHSFYLSFLISSLFSSLALADGWLHRGIRNSDYIIVIGLGLVILRWCLVSFAFWAGGCDMHQVNSTWDYDERLSIQKLIVFEANKMEKKARKLRNFCLMFKG